MAGSSESSTKAGIKDDVLASSPAAEVAAKQEDCTSPQSSSNPGKRRRRAPVTYVEQALGELENDELRMLHQAVENSRAENVNVDAEIEEGKTLSICIKP